MYEVDKYTVSLLHFDDGVKDETGKVWTTKNGAAVSTAASNFGGSSLYLNSAQYLSSPNNGDFSFGTGDFTVECWIKRNDYSNIYQNLYSTTSDNASTGNPIGYGCSLGLGHDFKGSFGFYNNNSVSSSIGVSGTTVIPVGKWTHLAGVRHNNTLYLFKNGILENTADCTGFSVNPNSTTLVNIGSYANDAWGNAYSGYIDELRVSNIARWTADFNLKSPTNLTAIAGDSQVTLSWTAVDGATSYNVKRSTTAGGTYTTIASNVTDTSYIDTSVTNGTTYYYVVTAVNADGESANSNEASATPVDSGKVLLVITMSDEVQKEYELSKAELDVFISWYNNRSAGNGLPYYIFNKSFNLGPFDSREDYIVFNKIENFEVMKFSK